MDNETGEYFVQEYEVVIQSGEIETRCDGIGEHLTPLSRRASMLYAAWGNGLLPAPGGMFRQPARAMNLIQYFGAAQSRAAERFRTRGKA